MQGFTTYSTLRYFVKNLTAYTVLTDIEHLTVVCAVLFSVLGWFIPYFDFLFTYKFHHYYELHSFFCLDQRVDLCVTKFHMHSRR